MALTGWRRVCRVETAKTFNNYNDKEASDTLVVVAMAALVQKNWHRIQT